MSSPILPHQVNTGRCTILPEADRERNTEFRVHKKSKTVILLAAAGSVLLIAAAVYIGKYISFQKRFEQTWSRVESSDGSYYTLKLDISDGTIEYLFDSWLGTEELATFSYTIIAPGKVRMSQGKYSKMISVEISDGMMSFSPAMTSAGKYEYWYD